MPLRNLVEWKNRSTPQRETNSARRVVVKTFTDIWKIAAASALVVCSWNRLAAQSTNAPAVPPPAAPAQRSAADLEKLVAPIALYPDPLIAVVLPASAYPLEIVQAARFVKDTNNIAKLDEQPWDDNVKAVARFPDVISQMDQNLSWTSDLGDAFVNQSKDLMDAVQTMRTKAQSSGALKTTEQQVVVVTNVIVEKTIEQQTTYVTNQIVQIQPAQPEVIYVPQYSPTVVYASYPVYPGYVYAAPYYPGYVAAASIVSFGAGMAMGAWMANGCNWGHGDVDVNVNKNVNRNTDRNTNRERNNSGNRGSNGGGQKWQPNQNKRATSGSASASREARGYGSGSGQNGARGGTGARPSTGNTGARPSTGNAGARPSTGTANSRPSAGASPSTRQSSPSGNRASTPSASTRQSPSSANRSTPSRSSSQGSAFSGANSGSSARQSSSRGSSSRSSGASRGGGGRSGGGGGRRR
jgi:hypothetical protein